ncbi:lysozyme [Oscillatoria sp. FACHB-1407]|nr:lysozyme [Oscillatoria sp. FACHB-1407]
MARSKAPVVQPIVPTGQSIAYRGATPPALQRVNAQGITLIKAYERLRLEAERCPAGVLTIGYGSTADVRPGQRITARQAEARLLKDLEPFEEVIRTVVRVPLTSNQFNALVSFAFNVGTTALIASTLLKKLNQGDYPGAAEQFLHWDKAGGTPLPLLTQRRQAEQALFLKA